MATQVECARCKATGTDPDELPEGAARLEGTMRNLVVGCGYDMAEVSESFTRSSGKNHLYSTPVCKDCRLNLLLLLHSWFTGKAAIATEVPPKVEVTGKRTVYMMGNDPVEVSDEEYAAMVKTGLIDD
jgi:hypothetical protein